MYDSTPFYILAAIVVISLLIILVAVFFALLGYFSKDLSRKQKYFAITGRTLIALTLFMVVGSGGCIMFIDSM